MQSSDLPTPLLVSYVFAASLLSDLVDYPLALLMLVVIFGYHVTGLTLNHLGGAQMKGRILLSWVVLIVFLWAGKEMVVAQSTGTKAPGTWVSSINIQNIGTEEATVVLNFYDASGNPVPPSPYTVTPPIPAGGSRSLYVPTQIPGLSNGQYSVIVSSNQPLQVVVNSSSTNPSTAGAYMGIQASQVGKTLYFPGLYKNYYGFYSQIVLQNVEETDATVTIKFYYQRTGQEAVIVGPFTIPKTSSRVFALGDLAAVPSGNVNGLLSAVVTSDKNLAGIANIWSSAYYGEYSDYNAYISGSTVVYAPALYKNYYGFVSSLTVQNLSNENADIRITYSNGVTETKTLLPFQAFEYYQPANPLLPSGNTNGVFSAKIESLNGKPIVVLVNIENKSKGLLASYNGPSDATTSTSCPVVLKAFYGWFSAQTVQNVGTEPTNITITYASGQSKTFNNVPPNGTVNIIELANAGSVLPDGSSVSAVITSSGQPIVAVVQENSETRYVSTPGDYLLAYTCVAK
jgi:hypothetical protein